MQCAPPAARHRRRAIAPRLHSTARTLRRQNTATGARATASAAPAPSTAASAPRPPSRRSLTRRPTPSPRCASPTRHTTSCMPSSGATRTSIGRGRRQTGPKRTTCELSRACFLVRVPPSESPPPVVTPPLLQARGPVAAHEHSAATRRGAADGAALIRAVAGRQLLRRDVPVMAVRGASHSGKWKSHPLSVGEGPYDIDRCGMQDPSCRIHARAVRQRRSSIYRAHVRAHACVHVVDLPGCTSLPLPCAAAHRLHRISHDDPPWVMLSPGRRLGGRRLDELAGTELSSRIMYSCFYI